MSTRKVSPRKATILTSAVLASTLIGAPALAASHIVTGASHVKAAAAVSTIVSRLSLSTGPSAGTNKVMIFGTGLATGTSSFTAKAVKFGTATVATDKVTALSTTALEVVVPAKATAAKVNVLVGDAVKGPTYTYVSPDLTVTTDQDDLDELAPSSDTGLAGAELDGTNFDLATTKVLVGGVAAKATATASKLTVAMPAGLTGVQDVVVSDPRNSVYVGYVTYAAKTPTLSAVSSYAVNEGPTPVTLTGTNLDAVTAVTFVKDTTSEKVAFTKSTTPTKLLVTVPKGSAKAGQIKVATKYGKTATFDLERKAAALPTVTAVTGAVAAGGEVTLTGTNLVGLKSVKVTSSAGKAVAGKVTSVTSATSAKVLLPKLAAGTYGVVATTLFATPSTSTSFSVGSSAPTATAATVDTAKTKVTVTGTNLKTITKVVLTPTTGTAITRTSGFTSAADGTSVEATLASALADGTYGVVVTNAEGSTSSVTLTVATAPAPSTPTLTAVSFDAEDTVAGTPAMLTLTGDHLEVGVEVRYYLDGDDPATDGTVVEVTAKGGSSSSADLAADLVAGSYKVEVATGASTWSTAVDLTVS